MKPVSPRTALNGIAIISGTDIHKCMDRFVLDWGHYRTFLAILKEGSQSGAARTLGLTQPTVGRHLDALEQAAGKPLFLRSHQGLAPTGTALAHARLCRAMASSAAALARAASGDVASGRKARCASAPSEVIGLEVPCRRSLADLQERYPRSTNRAVAVGRGLGPCSSAGRHCRYAWSEPTRVALLSRRIGGISARHVRPSQLPRAARHARITVDRTCTRLRL